MTAASKAGLWLAALICGAVGLYDQVTATFLVSPYTLNYDLRPLMPAAALLFRHPPVAGTGRTSEASTSRLG